MSLTKEQILATRPPVESVEWLGGDVVFVAAMQCGDRDAFEKENVEALDHDEHGHLVNFRARLLARCLVDEDGNRLFEDSDLPALSRVWAAPMDRAFAVARRLNGYSEEDLAELEKNSGSARSDSSGTT